MELELEIESTGNDVRASGTSLQGYVKATYEELEAVFGENIGSSDKTWNEFRADILVRDFDLETEDMVTATIYDWKESSPETARTGVYEWHVGGYCIDASWYVQDLLDAHRNKHN